jgi:hypothetical protein
MATCAPLVSGAVHYYSVVQQGHRNSKDGYLRTTSQWCGALLFSGATGTPEL